MVKTSKFNSKSSLSKSKKQRNLKRKSTSKIPKRYRKVSIRGGYRKRNKKTRGVNSQKGGSSFKDPPRVQSTRALAMEGLGLPPSPPLRRGAQGAQAASPLRRGAPKAPPSPPPPPPSPPPPPPAVGNFLPNH